MPISVDAAANLKNIFDRRASLNRYDACIDVETIHQSILQEEPMKASIRGIISSWLSLTGIGIPNRRLRAWLITASLSLLGCLPAFGQDNSSDAKKSNVTKFIRVWLPDSNPTGRCYKDWLAAGGSLTTQPGGLCHEPIGVTRASVRIPPAPCDSDLAAVLEVLEDGLEFTLAGTELSNRFGMFEQASTAFSWLKQELFQPDPIQLAASSRVSEHRLVVELTVFLNKQATSELVYGGVNKGLLELR